MVIEYPRLSTREKRSQIHLVRQRTARKIKFVDESGESLDQVVHG